MDLLCQGFFKAAVFFRGGVGQRRGGLAGGGGGRAGRCAYD
eukprot:COSAG06_NODE_20786_length_781_cov_1.228739_2_plen_40_part_01